MVKLKHFDISEFDSPDEVGSAAAVMDHDFLTMLDHARSIAGISFRITSGYRTPSHNAYVGGVSPSNSSKGSSHLYGYAADIAAPTSRERYIITKALLEAGFTRIGISGKNGFIHVDNDPEKDDRCIWTY
jgi:uncharacterized protein YcbK (DUF882 family)